MKISIIGCGNIGGAILKGAIDFCDPGEYGITVSDPREGLAEAMGLAGSGIKFITDNREAVRGADIIIIAVKPWLMEAVLNDIAGDIDRKRQAVVSIAAGITFAELEKHLSVDTHGQVMLYRVMPNTAISLGKSATFIAKHNTAAEKDEMVRGFFAATGEIYEIGEGLMPGVTSLASSGIAYALKYIDSASEAGERIGLSPGDSLHTVMQTIKGALALLDANGTRPQTEIDKVTTPNGVTLRGLSILEKGGFTETVINAILQEDDKA